MKDPETVPDAGKTPLHRMLDDCFLKHPRTVGESYWAHLSFTLKVGLYLIGTAFCIIIHGLIPRFFETTGSDRIRHIHSDLCARAEAMKTARADKSA
jgi:hypothetical protein